MFNRVLFQRNFADYDHFLTIIFIDKKVSKFLVCLKRVDQNFTGWPFHDRSLDKLFKQRIICFYAKCMLTPRNTWTLSIQFQAITKILKNDTYFLQNLQHEPHIDKDFNFGAGATFALSTCLESQFGKNMSLSNVWVYGIYD